MAGDGLLSLRWNNHRSSFLHLLSSLKDKKTYSDLTLACAGKFYNVHKFVLSTCSDYFVDIIDKTECKHPVIIINDMRPQDLEALLNYMYLGEVNVQQKELAGLIKAAEYLRVKGLAVPDEAAPSPSEDTRHSYHSSWEEDNYQPKRKRQEGDGSLASPKVKKSNKNSDHSPQDSQGDSNVAEDPEAAPGQEGDQRLQDSTAELQHTPHTQILENNIAIKSEDDLKYEEEEEDSAALLPHSNTSLDVQMLEAESHLNPKDQSYESSLPGGFSLHPQSFEEVVSEALPGPSAVQGDGTQSWDGRGKGDLPPYQPFPHQDGLTTPPQHNLPQMDMEETVQRVRGLMCGGEAGGGGVSASTTAALGQYGLKISPLGAGGGSTSDARLDREYRQAREWRCLYPECGYVTDRESWLKQHFRKHTGEKPFTCPFCSFRSAQKGNLNVHIKRVHFPQALGDTTSSYPPSSPPVSGAALLHHEKSTTTTTAGKQQSWTGKLNCHKTNATSLLPHHSFPLQPPVSYASELLQHSFSRTPALTVEDCGRAQHVMSSTQPQPDQQPEQTLQQTE